jgi:hypothetical protein
MGRQPDDLGTPALAWLACHGGSRPARSPGTVKASSAALQ